jgi:ribosomal protein S27AE
VINIWWDKVNEDYYIRFVILDRTPMIEEENREKTELFLYMIAKKLHIFTEETGIPIIPCRWYSGEEKWKEVEENRFIPFKDLDVRPITTALRDSEVDILTEFSGLKPKKTKDNIVEAKPVAKKSLFCSNCGSKVTADTVFCSNCGKRVVKIRA